MIDNESHSTQALGHQANTSRVVSVSGEMTPRVSREKVPPSDADAPILLIDSWASKMSLHAWTDLRDMHGKGVSDIA